MAVPISSFLSKASGAIPFLLRDSDLRGGYRVVTADADRDTIPVGARTSGMLVFTAASSLFHQWDGSAWQELDVTSMVSIGDGLTNDAETGVITIDQVRLAELFAASDHNHDEAYASKNHDHADVYAAKDHDHAQTYAAIEHTHTGYAAADHNHDDEYAAKQHTHTEYAASDHTHTVYAASNHTHTEYAAADHTHTGYAASDHNHDETYAAKDHGHTFEQITEVPKVSAMPGVTISTTEPAPTDGEDGDIWFVVA